MKNKVKIFGIIIVTVVIFPIILLSSCESLGSIGANAGGTFIDAIARDASKAIVGGIVDTITAEESDASIRKKISTTVEKASPEIIGSFSTAARLAVLSDGSSEDNYADYAVEDLEYCLIQSGFTLVDRRQISVVRTEQDFQLSGDVDDDSAVNIGKMTGAQFVITVGITYSNRSGRLTLKGLDVETGEIIAMVRMDIL
jgi:hypothetical protein